MAATIVIFIKGEEPQEDCKPFFMQLGPSLGTTDTRLFIRGSTGCADEKSVFLGNMRKFQGQQRF